ncbi:MAG: hypothetical protein JWO74_1573 [Solirubrobacterales bacterium]|nr:hypothetical protein [Solirubrobacterales bacterium]
MCHQYEADEGRLYLCDPSGTALSELKPGGQALKFDFTALGRVCC